MIIAALTALILLLGGSGALGSLYDLNDMDKRVQAAVADRDRRGAARAVVSDMKDSARRHHEVIESTTSKLDEHLSEFVADPAGVDDVWSVYMKRLKAFHNESIEQRFALRAQVSREEWALIFEAPAN